MKALIVDPYFDTLGGGERYALSFARTLKEQGYDVEIAWNKKEDLQKAETRFGLKFPFTLNKKAHQFLLNLLCCNVSSLPVNTISSSGFLMVVCLFFLLKKI